mmetsp:Transcript_24850/g.86544  ORF Transcript_24850/g.86544 Transcript_24850/m.86544 type:complete len:263 (+) Transcript_24850:254-1042(+)
MLAAVAAASLVPPRAFAMLAMASASPAASNARACRTPSAFRIAASLAASATRSMAPASPSARSSSLTFCASALVTSSRRLRSAVACRSIARVMASSGRMPRTSYRRTSRPQSAAASPIAPQMSALRSLRQWKASSRETRPIAARIVDCACCTTDSSGLVTLYAQRTGSTTFRYSTPSSSTLTLSRVMACCGWIGIARSRTSIRYLTRSTMGTRKYMPASCTDSSFPSLSTTCTSPTGQMFRSVFVFVTGHLVSSRIIFASYL